MKYGNVTLGQIEALINKLGGEEGIKRFLAGTVEVVWKKLLEQVGSLVMPAVEKGFRAKDHFVRDTSATAKVKISGWGGNFEKLFLNKVEQGEVAAETLKVSRLLEDAFDPAIVTDLGGEAKVEITLGQFFAAFAKQPNGEEGILLTNGYANVADVRDDEGVLWAVSGGWGDDGWYFNALSVDNPLGWLRDSLFLSR